MQKREGFLLVNGQIMRYRAAVHLPNANAVIIDSYVRKPDKPDISGIRVTVIQLILVENGLRG